MSKVISIIGQLATTAGYVAQADAIGNPLPFKLRAPTFCRRQSRRIPLFINHDDPIPADVEWHLERGDAIGLVGVARVEQMDPADLIVRRGEARYRRSTPDTDIASLLDDGPWYFSVNVRVRSIGVGEFGVAEIDEVSIVRHTATVNAHPVAWIRSDVRDDQVNRPRALKEQPTLLYWNRVWTNAHGALHERRYRRAADTDHIEIVDLDKLNVIDEVYTDVEAAKRRAQSPVPMARSTTRRRPQEPQTFRRPALGDGVLLTATGADLAGKYIRSDGEVRYVRSYGPINPADYR